MKRLVLLALLLVAISGAATAAIVPAPVVEAVHGRVVGWAKTGSDWFVVYVDHKGRGWCGLEGASWRMALVETSKLRRARSRGSGPSAKTLTPPGARSSIGGLAPLL